MRVWAVTLLALATLQPSVVIAHVAPAVDENNRYLKISPMGSRLQLAYVVFVGEVPGQEMRKVMGAEHQRHAETLASDVAEKLVLEVDGQPVPISWDRVAVDLAASKDHASALSISMIAWVCLDPAPEHRIELRDGFELPPPGENELLVEPGPGVTVRSSALGDESGSRFQWVGLPNPMTEHGYRLMLAVDAEQAVVIDDGRCPAPGGRAADAEEASPGRLVAAIVVGLLLMALLVFSLRRASSR